MSVRDEKKLGQVVAFIITAILTALAGIFFMTVKINYDVKELSESLGKIADLLEKQQRSN